MSLTIKKAYFAAALTAMVLMTGHCFAVEGKGRVLTVQRKKVLKLEHVPPHTAPPIGSYGELLTLSDLGKEAVGIQTKVVERISQPTSISMPGRIEAMPTRQFDQHAPLSGRIAKVLVEPGQQVVAGQMLAIIDSPEMNALAAEFLQSRMDTQTEYSRQKAACDEEVRQAQEKLNLAEANLRRIEKLFEAKITPQKDVLNAQTELVLAQTRLKTASENRDIFLKALKAKIRLMSQPLRQRLEMLGVDNPHIEEMLKDQTTLTSVPLFSARSGVVMGIMATPGQSIDPSVTLFNIADLSRVWATANVYEDDMARMRVGEPVEVTVHGIDGPPMQAVLTYIGNAVDASTRTLPVRAEMDNPSRRLKPDMFAELFIQTADSQPMITLPYDAVVHNSGHSIVFVERPQGYLPVYVKLGRNFGDRVEIIEGLNVGEKVVVRGAFQLAAELVKQQGGDALFTQPMEGERLESTDDETGAKGSGGLNMNLFSVVGLVVVAFLFGAGLAMMILGRYRNMQNGGEPLNQAKNRDAGVQVKDAGTPGRDG